MRPCESGEIPSGFYYLLRKLFKKLKNSLDIGGLLKTARQFLKVFTKIDWNL